jgi:hypothetical protein
MSVFRLEAPNAAEIRISKRLSEGTSLWTPNSRRAGGSEESVESLAVVVHGDYLIYSAERGLVIESATR